MSVSKHIFRPIAFATTDDWVADAFKGTRAENCFIFEVCIYREGEHTYCCELTPSYWCERVDSVGDGTQFVRRSDGETDIYAGIDDEYALDAARTAVEDIVTRANVGNDVGSYRHYHSIDAMNPIFLGPAFEVEIDEDDLDADPADEDAFKQAVHDAAWEAAREALRTGAGQAWPIPALHTPGVYLEHRRAMAAKAVARELDAISAASNPHPGA